MQDEAEKAESRAAEEMDAEVDRILSGTPKGKSKPQDPVPTEADIALQRRLISRLEDLVGEGEYAVTVTKKAVAAAVGGVVVAKVHDLIPEMEKARAEFARLAAAFTAARSAIEFDRDGPYAQVDSLLRAEPGAAIRFAGLDQTGEGARWQAAIARLARDPDAPLH
jgi:hypothetical protein